MVDINFPTNPSNGDTYLNYIYDSSIPGWKTKAPDRLSDLSNVSISGKPAHNSMLQYDGTSEWYAAPGLYFPVGGISVYGGQIAPEGYLFCSGQVLLRSSYPKLFSVIGTMYNTGSELATQFRLPNISGRVVVGRDNLNNNFNELGKSGGSKTHTLTISEMPEHSHVQDEHTHTQNTHNHTQDAHNHGISIGWNPSGWEAANFGIAFFGSYTNSIAVTGGWSIGTDSRTPTIQGTTATNNPTTATNQNTGGGQPHNNMQPYLVTNYIIRHS